MIAAIIDTHALIWYLNQDERLAPRDLEHINKLAAEGKQVGVATISLVEMVYLAEKGKIPLERYEIVADAVRNDKYVMVDVPLTLAISETLRSIPRELVPDMPDRIIAATAVQLGLPLITKDAKIIASRIRTIW